MSDIAQDNINTFYVHTAMKWRYTYGYDDMCRDIRKTYIGMYDIDDDYKREPILTLAPTKSIGRSMAHIGRWYYAYKVKDNTIFVIDACHQQNMHELQESILEPFRKSSYILPELAEFHSWMKRLDEVKGTRPTYWCK